MYRSKVLIIIPAYNEENAIRDVIYDIREHVPDADLVVINDGSTDDTEQIALSCGAKVLTVPFNVGIGGGMQIGYIYAKQIGYDYAVQMDADGQHRAADLPGLLERAHNYDLMIGSRFVEETEYRSSPMRRLGILFFSWLVTFMTGQKFTDTTSGFRVAGSRAIALFADYYPTDYPEVESIIYLKRRGCRITESRVNMRQRETGRSSITPVRSVYYMIKVTLSVFMSAVRYRNRRAYK